MNGKYKMVIERIRQVNNIPFLLFRATEQAAILEARQHGNLLNAINALSPNHPLYDQLLRMASKILNN